MIVVSGLEEFPSQPDFVAVALGNFDGVHKGHQKLMTKLVEKARKKKGICVVFTFHPHPLQILAKDTPLLLLNTPEDKERLIRKLGVDFFIPFPFNRDVAAMTPLDFVNNILFQGLRAKSIFVGYNFTFGRNAEGNAKMLDLICQEKGCEVNIIPEVKQGDISVSSTNIRELLFQGNIKMANLLLGYAYSLSGTVIAGNKIGSKMGFPTANLPVPKGLVIPANGVYAVKVQTESGLFDGVANIGHRPTLGYNLPQSIEIHILDQCLDLYDQNIRVFFIDRLRMEQKFRKLDQLMAQIQTDVKSAKNILNSIGASVDL